MRSSETGQFVVSVMIILAVLRALGCIGLSWWWITLPLWIAPAIGVAFVALALAVFVLLLLLAVWLG